MWDSLPTPWQACLQEAWAAYCAGSLPIGAVVVNGAGEVISRGRNSTRDGDGKPISDHDELLRNSFKRTDDERPFSTGDGQPIVNHRLAHAEINALLAADFRAQPPRDCTLYASTEPCPLCTGAAVMANIGRIAYASRDPWAGGTDLLSASEYMRRQGVQLSPPQDPALESALIAIQVEWHMHADAERSQPLLVAWRAISPAGVAGGEALHASGELRKLAAAGAGEGAGAGEALKLLNRTTS